jgi:hypothetical protein
MFDDQSDRSSPEEAKRKAEIMADALRHPDKPRPKGEWVGGEFARQYGVLLLLRPFHLERGTRVLIR